MELYPEYFPEEVAGYPCTARVLPEWETEEWPAVRVGNQWYGGWPRRYLYQEWKEAERYAVWMRRLYHCGILCLLVGLTALVWPPESAGSLARWVLVFLGAIGVALEALWILVQARTTEGG